MKNKNNPESNSIIIEKILGILKDLARDEGKRASRLYSVQEAHTRMDSEIASLDDKIDDLRERVLIIEQTIKSVKTLIGGIVAFVSVIIPLAALFLKYCK